MTPSHLTPKEVEVVTLITCGYSNKQIAKALNSTESTIKNHVTAILQKWQLNGRTEAAVYALYCGVVPLEDAYRAIVERRRRSLDL